MPTHIRSILGHLRYDTKTELELINSLYRENLRLYKNFFQPVMKLKEKIRDKGKVHRRYDTPKTPYQRLIESSRVPETAKSKLKALYLSFNPLDAKRSIDVEVNKLYKAYEEKNNSQTVAPLKKQNLVRLHLI